MSVDTVGFKQEHAELLIIAVHLLILPPSVPLFRIATGVDIHILIITGTGSHWALSR
jgi:hypothetical protein